MIEWYFGVMLEVIYLFGLVFDGGLKLCSDIDLLVMVVVCLDEVV